MAYRKDGAEDPDLEITVETSCASVLAYNQKYNIFRPSSVIHNLTPQSGFRPDLLCIHSSACLQHQSCLPLCLPPRSLDLPSVARQAHL